MAHTLDLKVVVEGVETLSQVELLRPFGDCSLQGYYYSKPISVDEFLQFIYIHNVNKNSEILI